MKISDIRQGELPPVCESREGYANRSGGSLAGILATAVVLAVFAVPAQAQAATKVELELKRWAEAHREEQAATLEQLVNIQSGTMNVAGVRGSGAHTPDEFVDLRSLPTATARAAVFLYRLSRAPQATP